MSVKTGEIYTYQCRKCLTVATSGFDHPYTEPLRCNLCFSYMKRLYVQPITSLEQQALVDRGVVYNPGVNTERRKRREPIRCENTGCKGYYSELYGYEIEAVGKFCSAKCLDEGVKRHRAALEQPPAHLMGESTNGN